MTEEEKRELQRLNMPDQWDGMLGAAYDYHCGITSDCDER